MAIAGSIILATTRIYHARLYTMDADFPVLHLIASVSTTKTS